MSPKKPVPILSYLSLKRLENLVIHTLSNDEPGDNFDTVCNYMAAATYDTLQELLREILRNISLDASTRVNCLGVLLREDVKKLEVDIFPRFYYEKILEIITTRGKRLQHLNLKGVWVRDYPHLLNKMIKSATNLRTLIIPHMADDTVLETIGEHLKSLTHLDISGEACYTSQGVKNFKSDTLKVLNIGTFGKPSLIEGERDGIETISELLQNLPNLTSLKTYSFTGQSLLLLSQNYPEIITNITYFHDTNTTKEVIDAVVRLCPFLESVHLDSAEKGVILELGEFRKLNSLKLTRADVGDLQLLLSVLGDQLQFLKLNCSKIKCLDLSEICITTPNLINLELFQMKLIALDWETYFVNLQSLEILYCEVADSTLRYLMTNAPFLTRMVIGCVVTMTDGDIFRICAETNFPNLEELWLSQARSLTIISAELLMGHCPKLKSLGQLNGWDVSQEEVDYLREVIMASNTDLTLLPIGRF